MTDNQIRDAIFSIFKKDGVTAIDNSPYSTTSAYIDIYGEDILSLWFEPNYQNPEYLSFFTAFDFIDPEEYEKHEQEWRTELKENKSFFSEIERTVDGLVLLRGQIAKEHLTTKWFESMKQFLHERTPLINELLAKEKQFELDQE